jgi:precorrin-2 dehydrogenase/sirohydrochlorin ferrochelatase
LTIAISTGGKSPSLSAKIKRELEEKYDEEYEEYIKLLGEIRTLVLEKCCDEAIRKDILRNIINMNIEELRERRGLYESCHRITGK